MEGLPQNPPPGWYPDPERPGSQRWWDGTRWTEHVGAGAGGATGGAFAAGSGVKPESPFATGGAVATGGADQTSRHWATAAHLSALVALVIGFSFLGPLVVYLIKKDADPYVRAHAAEALNFNLSVLIYAFVGGFVLVIAILLIVGVILIPVAIAAAIAWIVLIVIAGVRASKGELYRYPLTIRFVS